MCDVSTRLTHEGETRTIKEWAARKEMNPSTLVTRMISGWTAAEALETPVREYHKHKHYTERRIWRNMIGRCHDPFHSQFARFGALGFTVCRRWLDSFQDFLKDVGREPGRNLTIGLEDPEKRKVFGPDTAGWMPWFKVSKAHDRIWDRLTAGQRKRRLQATEERQADARGRKNFPMPAPGQKDKPQRKRPRRGPDRKPRKRQGTTTPPTGIALDALLALYQAGATQLSAREVGLALDPEVLDPAAYVGGSLESLCQRGFAGGEHRRPRLYRLTAEGREWAEQALRALQGRADLQGMYADLIPALTAQGWLTAKGRTGKANQFLASTLG